MADKLLTFAEISAGKAKEKPKVDLETIVEKVKKAVTRKKKNKKGE